jgi:hypothetical protein
MTDTKTQPRDFTDGFNRFMYLLSVALGFYFLIANHDVSSAMSTLGIALIFDPFKHEVPWNARPRYQKAVLLLHVSVVFILLGILVFRFFAN